MIPATLDTKYFDSAFLLQDKPHLYNLHTPSIVGDQPRLKIVEGKFLRGFSPVVHNEPVALRHIVTRAVSVQKCDVIMFPLSVGLLLYCFGAPERRWKSSLATKQVGAPADILRQ